MATKPISIPINIIVPGSQPDSGDAMTIGVPETVGTFSMPRTPEVSDKKTAENCRKFFIDLYQEMKHWNVDSGDPGPALALNMYDVPTLELINQMLGKGEISISISIPNVSYDEIRIQESIFVGVWRVRYYRDGKPITDQVEVSALPACVAEAAYATSQDGLEKVEFGPEAMNSPAIIAEIEQALKNWVPGAPAFTVNLSHLPMSAKDNEIIDKIFKRGAVDMLATGFGHCRITSTSVRHVWRIQYFGNPPASILVLNTLSVTGLPDEAIAAPEDLRDSIERIKELIEWVSRSWELPPVKLE